MKDNISTLYGALKNKGYTDIGKDETEFRDWLGKEGNVKALYGALSQQGFDDIGDEQQFTDWIGLAPQSETAAQRMNKEPMQPYTHEYDESGKLVGGTAYEALEPYQYKPEVQDYILKNKPDMFKRNKASLMDVPLGNGAGAPELSDEKFESRIGVAQRNAQDPIVQKGRNEAQVRGLSASVDDELADIEEKIVNRTKALRGTPNVRDDRGLAEYRGERSYLEGAKELMEESQKIINAAKAEKDGTFAGGLARGVRDTAFDVDNWTMGISDLVGGLRLKRVLEDFEAGKELSPAQERLLEAAITNMATTAWYESDLGRGYKAGQVTGESLPFMLEMMVNPISASGNAMAKSLLKAGLKKFGSAVNRNVVKATTRLATDALAATGMAATTGAPAVLGESLDRMNRNYEYGFDGDGNLSVKKTGDTSFGEALGRSFTTRAIENQSEMIFNAFKGAGQLFRGADKYVPGGVNKFFDWLGNSQVGQAWRSIKNSPLRQELMKAAQIGGIGEEYLEEVYNNLANFAIGEMEWKDVVDLDRNIDTFLGLAPTQVMFSMIGLGGMAAERYQTRKDINRLREGMTEEQQAKLDELLSMGTIARNVDVRGYIRGVMADESLTPEQKRASIEAAYDVAKQNAVEQIAEAETEDTIEAENAQIDSVTDPSTGMYTEVERIMVDERGETVRQPGYVVGWIGSEPVFVPEGVDNVQENRIVLKPNEWDPSTLQSMENGRVKALNEEMVREEAAAQAERESKYAPEVANYVPQPQDQVTDANGQVLTAVAATPDGVTYLDEKGQVNQIPLDAWRDLMQAQIDAQEAQQAQAEEAAANTQAVVENMPRKTDETGRIFVPKSVQGDEVAYDITDAQGNPLEQGTSKVSQFAKMQDYVAPVDEQLNDDGTSGESVGEQVNSGVNNSEELQPVAEGVASAAERAERVEEKPVIPTKEDGSVDFVAYGKEGSFKVLGERYGEKMPNKVAVTAKALADDLNKAQQKLDKAEEAYDNAPIGREAKAEAARDKARQELEAVKREADFWAEMDAEIKAAQQRREEILNPTVKVEASNEPLTADEFIAQQLSAGNIVLNKDDYMRETGYGSKEANAMNGGAKKLLSAEGMTIQEAGERLMEMDRENGTNFFDQEDPNAGRDALISLLGSVKSRKDLNGYVSENRKAQAERDAEGLRNETERAVMDAHFASLEDFVLQMEVDEVENPFLEDRADEIMAIFADEVAKYEQSLNNTENEQGRTNEVAEGSDTVLPEEQSDDTGGTEERSESERVGDGIADESEGAHAGEQGSEAELKQQEGETILQFAERVAEEQRRRPLRKRANEWSKALGVKVTFLESLDDVDERTRAQIEAEHAEGSSVPGWVSINGEVFFFMPDLLDAKDVDDTYIHEVVAHIGIPSILGKERFNELCDKVWDMMPQSEKDFYEKKYPGVKEIKNETLRHRRAADEYIAHLAENENLTPEEKTIWDNIVRMFRDMLDKALNGIIGKSKITNEDISNLIKASYANLKAGAEGVVNGEGTRFNAKRVSDRRQDKNRVNNTVDQAVAFVMGKDVKEVKAERLEREQKRKEDAAEIYQSVLSGDFNDVTLRKINDYIDDATPLHPYGKRISQRLPQKLERDLHEGSRTNAVDALFSRICESSVPASRRTSEAGRREIEERKKESLKGWAIATNNWHTDLSEFTDEQTPFAKGTDSEVFLSKDGKYVIKTSFGKPEGKRFRPDIDNIPLFNHVFRNSAYEIVGYGEFDGKFARILKQPFVEFAEDSKVSVDERVDYMRTLGFKPINEANTAFSNGNIIVADLQKSNIVKTAKGNIRVIDADVKLHTKDVGGNYTYPPVEADVPEGTRFRRVFHGSGASFDRFDHSFMSTGEGNQSFGWGTYVTEVEGIGRTYAGLRADNSPVAAVTMKWLEENPDYNTFITNGEGARRKRNVEGARAWLEEMKADGKPADIIAAYERDLEDTERMISEEGYEETFKNMRDSLNRNLYAVDIPDESDGARYIDYKNPMNSQGDALKVVAKGLRAIGWEHQDVDGRDVFTHDGEKIVLNPYQSGADLYEELSVAFGSDKAASDFLNDIGFTGIAYPANYYNGGTEDNAKNYVIFNEDDLEIVEHTRFRFIGERGARNLDKAEEATTRLDNLGVAREMEAAEKDAKAIKMATGWERGADGKWRYEVDDVEIKDISDVQRRLGNGDMLALKNVLTESSYNKIVTEYPKIQDVKFYAESIEGYGGGYYDGANIVVGKEYIWNNDFLRETVVHELQHAIQEYEGFERGTSPEEMKDLYYEQNSDIKTASRYTIKRAYQVRKKADKLIKNGKYRYYAWAVRSAIGNLSSKAGYGWGEPVETLARLYSAEELKNEYESISEHYRLIGGLSLSEEEAINSYKRNSGEVEARNVEQRMGMTDEQRRNSLAESTEDVAREDQIFLQNAIESGQNAIRFRISNNNQEVFVSNAQRAVEGIKQEKGTPQQWLAMIEKNSGLKAGEDKWLGLSDWLKASDKKSMTKNEILDFINQNKIRIEEVKYSGSGFADEWFEDDVYDTVSKSVADSRGVEFRDSFMDAFEFEYDDYVERVRSEISDDERALSLYNEATGEGLELDEDGYIPRSYINKVRVWADDVVSEAMKPNGEEKPINSTRLNYTTEGLENNQEIALVVPTIEPWNESDEIHFGDAGEGRAVAWVRFGETYVMADDSYVREVTELKEPYRDVNGLDIYKTDSGSDNDFIAHGKARNGEMIYAAYVNGTQIPIAHKTLEDAMDGMNKYFKEHPIKNRKRLNVLVIDEIQSKRHQEGRENGYRNKSVIKELENLMKDANEKSDSYFSRLRELKQEFGLSTVSEEVENEWRNSDAELARRYEERKEAGIALSEFRKEHENELRKSVVPEAPFEKNWHELAMKRMLRYAAENGYDKVAWTKGEQQAERYSLSKVVDNIRCNRVGKNGNKSFVLEGLDYNVVANNEGLVVAGADEFKGKHLSEIVGTSLSDKMLTMEEGDVLNNTDLRIGGEGMKGFYDRMLPSFVNKYVKKWGTKVQDVELPNVEEAGRFMHSVDVTDAMKESVMEGQTMFRISDKGRKIQDNVDKFAEKYNSKGAVVAEVSSMSDEEIVEALGLPADKVRKAIGEGLIGGYDDNRDKIIIFADNQSLNDLEDTMFHENLHVLLADNRDVVESFYANAAPRFPKNIEYLKEEGYKDKDIPEELFVRLAAKAMDYGIFDDVIYNLPEEMFDRFKEIINKFGYGYRQEIKSRILGKGRRGTSHLLEGEEIHETARLGLDKRKRQPGTGRGSERAERLRDLFGQVADMGLEGVLGNRAYSKLMVDIFKELPEGVRVDLADDALRHYGGSTAPAVSDYVNKKGKASLWDKIAGFIREALRKVGIELDINANDAKYILWRSQKPLNRVSLLDVAEDIDMRYRMKVGEFEDSPTRFRSIDEVNERFNKQLDEFIEEGVKANAIFQLGKPSGAMKLFLPDLPIVMRPRIINKASNTKHNVDASALRNLPSMISEPIFVFKRNDDALGVLTEINDRDGKNVCVAIELNKTIQDGGIMLEVNDIRSIHGRDVANLVLPIAHNNTLVYADKKKGLAWLSSASYNYQQEIDKKDLDSATKIVESFENPKVGRENVRKNDGGTRFRVDVGNKLNIRDQYESTIKKGGYQAREAVQDSMLSLRRAQELIEKAEGKELRDFENAWMHENRLSSVVQSAIHEMERKFYKPMTEAVKKLMDAAKIEQEQVADYLMLKHGIERNREMAVRKALTDSEGKIDRDKLNDWYEEKRRIRNDASLDTWRKKQEAMDDAALMFGADMSRDYSGLTSMFDTDDLDVCTQRAYDEVEAMENAHPAETEALGKAIKAMTQSTLDESFGSGLMDRKVYDELSNDMYDYYIPLRGFEETTSDEVYAYMDNDRGAFNAPLVRAKGRSSKADNPLAYLKSIAESGIMQGERNKMKQTFLNMVMNHPSDLVSVREGVWAVFNPATGEWEAASFPESRVPRNASPADVEAAYEQWEADMEQQAATDPNVKKISEAADVPYRVIGNRMNQHQVIVKRLGKSYTLTINGNPRLAMALNGLTNPNNTSNDRKAFASLQKGMDSLNRQLSAWYTTRNPDFVASNFMRDTFYTNTIVRAKEGNHYANRFHAQYAKLLMPGRMVGLFRKYENGTLDLSNPMERDFHEFMMNGGETGYSNLKDLEDIKKQIAKDVKGNRFEKVGKALEVLDLVNRAVENTARFAAYRTSRQQGRSVARSIFDAKEISVNFNKKGAGDTFFKAPDQTWFGNLAAMVGAGGRAMYVFFNAAIQGTTNLLHVTKKNPVGAGAGLGAMFLMGAVIPMLLGGDDEKDYYDLPEHVRRNHLVLPGTGDAWVSIPLPIEYRIMYGMGELLTSWRTGHERGSDIGRKMLSMTGQALPLNFLEEGVDAFVPSAISPLWQVYNNRSWTGLPIYKDNEFNKDNPEYTKAYKNVDRGLYKFTKALYEWTFDEENQEEGIDLNPAVIEHVAKGYFGGLVTTLGNVVKTAETIAGEREFDWRSIPIGNRIFKSGDERTKEKRIQNEYFENVDKLEFMQSRERLLKKTKDGDGVPEADRVKAQRDYEVMQGSEVYKKYIKDPNSFKNKKKAADKIYRQRKEKDSEELERKYFKALEDANGAV